MGLTRYKLGELIQLSEDKNNNGDFLVDNVKGISIQKIFIKTKADMNGVSLNPYLLAKPDNFAYVTVTSRNSEKITIAHNETDNTYIVSSSYVVFSVSNTDILSSDYLFMYFNRPEFDRYTRFNSWGSARETFNWQDMCDIEIDLPSLPIQQKYVDVFNAMQANQKAYESGLEDLKLTCDAYIEKLLTETIKQPLGEYLAVSDVKNTDLKYSITDVKGVSIDKKFIETKANMDGVSLSPYLLVEPLSFCYVTVTSRNGEKISIAMNGSANTYIVSSSYVVFRIVKSGLLPAYLFMYLSRREFDHFARFNSWGSARETLSWDDLCRFEIPIPNIEIQQDIVNIFNAHTERKNIAQQLSMQMKNICPILIKGSLEEAERA